MVQNLKAMWLKVSVVVFIPHNNMTDSHGKMEKGIQGKLNTTSKDRGCTEKQGLFCTNLTYTWTTLTDSVRRVCIRAQTTVLLLEPNNYQAAQNYHKVLIELHCCSYSSQLKHIQILKGCTKDTHK